MSAARIVSVFAFVDKQGKLVKGTYGLLTFETEDEAKDWLDERYHYGQDGIAYAQTLTLVPLVGRY